MLDINEVRVGDGVRVNQFVTLDIPYDGLCSLFLRKGDRGIITAIDPERRFLTVEILLPGWGMMLIKLNAYNPQDGNKSQGLTINLLDIMRNTPYHLSSPSVCSSVSSRIAEHISDEARVKNPEALIAILDRLP